MDDDLFSFAARQQRKTATSPPPPAPTLENPPRTKAITEKKEPEGPISVGALTRAIRRCLEGQFGRVWVEGEISNLRRQNSGHLYFTLKDAESQISCVIFRLDARGTGEKLRDGLHISLEGELSVFEPRGSYQIVGKKVHLKGEGALQAQFEELKRRLQAEGLFDPARKRPTPTDPSTICLVTSPTGAAVRDLLNVIQRRAPWVRVLILPVRVQGAGAGPEIAAALRTLARISQTSHALPPIDTVILARGGGSIEDLWPFNDESLARAIADFPLPIVSAVGHEIDFTIADFVADQRAPTPVPPQKWSLQTARNFLGASSHSPTPYKIAHIKPSIASNAWSP